MITEHSAWTISFPKQALQGLSRSSPRKLEIEFSAPVTDAEFINVWLLLKNSFKPSNQRPEGWEPVDKSDPEDWEIADGE